MKSRCENSSANFSCRNSANSQLRNKQSRIICTPKFSVHPVEVFFRPAITAAIGQQLGIEGAEDSTDLSISKPSLGATDLTGGNVQLDFSKSKSDGVSIYSKRDSDADFTFLSRDTSSPYVDNRPLLAAGKPEVRRYKAIYVSNDHEIGQFSDEVVATCQP